MPKRRAASRWLSPSTWQAWRTRAYSSTAFILTLPAVRTGRKIRRRLFTPPPRPDTPAASVRDFLSAAYMLHAKTLDGCSAGTCLTSVTRPELTFRQWSVSKLAARLPRRNCTLPYGAHSRRPALNSGAAHLVGRRDCNRDLAVKAR